ncbi:hypothetical protein TCAL_12499 [Tigriopus californicus]|uniref:G-protein coupled receptors family 1 profile domain-containing protein n=1 Tax=Tigriopus californicus TaxID=6832 RepID=A0A553P1G8_TIGCA|nr:FMRFamide receptor-like [Tigriopus californicus]TRY71537.1 hypothetical protein TCAL_12499 [Tigriopus californicus]
MVDNITLDLELDCGGQITEHYQAVWGSVSFWLDGVLTPCIGTVGLIGNLLSIAVFSTRQMRKFTFNYLLLALAVFDLIFIVCAIPVHSIPSLNLDSLNELTGTRGFGLIYRYFLYPFTTVAYSGGVYMTVTITIERFVAVCRPHSYRESLVHTSPGIRALKYVLPVIVFSLVLNIPKFLEIEVHFVNGSSQYTLSEIRRNPNFIWWYTHSLIIHPFLTTTVVPIILLCVLNIKIYRGILKARINVHNSNNHGELNLAVVFVTLCSLFILSHSLRIYLAVRAVIEAPITSACMDSHKSYLPPIHLVCLEATSNLLILTNSSCNIFVYCTCSTHFKMFFHKLCLTHDHTLSSDSLRRHQTTNVSQLLGQNNLALLNGAKSGPDGGQNQPLILLQRSSGASAFSIRSQSWNKVGETDLDETVEILECVEMKSLRPRSAEGNRFQDTDLNDPDCGVTSPQLV